jgi:hypothetical protein
LRALVLGAFVRDESGLKNAETCFQKFFRMISLNLVLEEKVTGVSNLMSLDLSEHDYHGVQGFGNVHGTRLGDRLVVIFEEMVI